MPPKFWRSCSSFLTSMTFGKPSMPFTNGYSIGFPMCCAKAMNCAGVSGWSWKKMTWCSRKARRISATASGDSPAARSTASISAPSAPAMRLTFKLLDLDVRFAHDFAVARLLGAQERHHFVGCIRDRIQAQGKIALPQVLRLHRFLDLARKAREHLARRPGRGRVADPGADVEPGQVRRLGERRHVGHRGGAPRERHAERLEASRFHMRDGRGDGLDGVGDLAIHD